MNSRLWGTACRATYAVAPYEVAYYRGGFNRRVSGAARKNFGSLGIAVTNLSPAPSPTLRGEFPPSLAGKGARGVRSNGAVGPTITGNPREPKF